MIKLFTDSDLDGLGCGLVAKLAFGENVEVTYCSYRNLNERVEKFIDHPKHKNHKVYITDLAVNEKIEKKLADRFKHGQHIQMVDHHVTALHFNEYKWARVIPEYENGKKTCATSLFYEFLLATKEITENQALEEFIELVRQYDTWEWEANNNTNAKRLNDLFFIIGMEQFDAEMLVRLNNNDHFSLSDSENYLLDIEERKIDRYIQSKNRQIVQTFIDDYCVGIVHAEQYISELGNALAKLNPHLDLIALVNVGTKKVGYRTIYDEVDVSKFAQRFGGGGHPKASGSSLEEDAYKIFVNDVFTQPSLKIDAPKNLHNNKDSKNGSLYTNRSGDYTVILPNKDYGYRIFHNGNSLTSFATFDEAERYVKRSFASSLAFDNDLVEYLCKLNQIEEDEIKNNIQAFYSNLKDKLI